MNIRKATHDDICAIQDLAEVVFRHTYREILTPDQMEYMMDWMYSTENLLKQMDESHHHYLILEDNHGNDIGYGSFNLEGQTSHGALLFHLQKIYVLPGYQGNGSGAYLLHAIEKGMKEIAGDQSFRYELNVNRNNKAVGFYEHMGLRKDRQGDFHIGNGYYMNDYIMVKDITVAGTLSQD